VKPRNRDYPAQVADDRFLLCSSIPSQNIVSCWLRLITDEEESHREAKAPTIKEDGDVLGWV